MIENYEQIIKDECAKVGLDDVSVLDADPSASDAWIKLIRSNKKSDCRLEADGLLHPAAVAVAISSTEYLENSEDEAIIDLLTARARNAAATLKALFDQRKPEEIPA